MTLVAMALQFDWQGQTTGLVAVCDKLLSSNAASVSLPYSKFVRWGSSWILGYSGDPSLFAELRYKTSIAGDIDQLTGFEAADRLKKSYKDLRQREIEDSILASLGYDFPSFYANGFAQLGPEKFHAVCEAIQDYCLDLDLLLGGTSLKDGISRLYKIENPGRVHDALIIGFEAIGSGSPIALGHLYNCYKQQCTQEQAMARILEAKFMSESQRNVGSESVLISLLPDCRAYIANEAGINKYRATWNRLQRSLPVSRTSLLTVTQATSF